MTKRSRPEEAARPPPKRRQPRPARPPPSRSAPPAAEATATETGTTATVEAAPPAAEATATETGKTATVEAAPPRRRRFLGGVIVLGFFGLLIALVLSLAVRVPIFGVGDRSVHPMQVAALHDKYELGIGNFDVDLSDLNFPLGETHVKTSLGIGDLRVGVPRGIAVDVDGEASGGQVVLFGHADDGVLVDSHPRAGHPAEPHARPRRRGRPRPARGKASMTARSLRLRSRSRASSARADQVVAGVAAGIGEALAVDPTLVRLAFAFLSFASGAGIVAYLGLWALLPAPDATQPSRTRQVVGAILLVWAAILALRGLGLSDPFVWMLALVQSRRRDRHGGDALRSEREGRAGRSDHPHRRRRLRLRRR